MPIAVAPMDPSLVESPVKRWTRMRNANHDQCGLSDAFSISPRSVPSTPEVFVVTPEGKTLAAVKELHVDNEGQLHVVDRAVPDLTLGNDFTIKEVPIKKIPTSPFAESIQGLCEVKPLIGWSDPPKLTWEGMPSMENDITHNHHHDNIKIIKVDNDGTAIVQEVPVRAYNKRNHDIEEEEAAYVADERGEVHYAHQVFIAGPEGEEVVIRVDEDSLSHCGVWDTTPVPNMMLTSNSDIVLISEEHGETHLGRSCMIAAPNGELMIYSRPAEWPVPDSIIDRSLKIEYQTPKQIGWVEDKSRPREFFYMDVKGKPVPATLAVMLGARDKVVLGLRSHTDGDTLLVSEDGRTTKQVHLRELPVRTPTMDTVVVGAKKCNYLGVNVMTEGPDGIVMRATRSRPYIESPKKSRVRSGMKTVAGYIPVTGLRKRECLCLEYPALKRIKARPAYKINRGSRELAANRHNASIVNISRQDGPVVYRVARPNGPSTYDGVFVADTNAIHRGHSVIARDWDTGRCSTYYAPDFQ